MMEFFKKLSDQMKDVFGKLDRTKKIIIAVVTGVVVIAFIVLFSVSSGQPNIVLFSELNADDFGQVTKKLDEMGYHYQTAGQTNIHGAADGARGDPHQAGPGKDDTQGNSGLEAL